MFLTRIPIPGKWNIGTAEVGRSTVFFPLVGAGIGALQWLLLRILISISGQIGHRSVPPFALPAPVLAVLVIAFGVWITGALHLDGVADMADGFGGGRTREDVLRIMRDHAIGSYGAVALILILALKFASLYVLIERGTGLAYLIIAPVLARWSIVVLGLVLPYARAMEGGLGAAATLVDRREALFSTAIAFAITVWVGGWRGVVCLLVCLAASGWNARVCMRRIQGITGDTLGANTEVCEALVLAVGCILPS